MKKMRKRSPDFLKKDKSLSPFCKRAYKVVLSIPRGQVRSYKWVAKKIGNPKSFRAIGQALNRNPYIGLVPCHRVIRENGSLGGFSKGRACKRRLLKREGLDLA